ncbi:MAG: hypothetical protein JWM14_120 [Chitinophagaceae bacterium]|nr:hypothetical protein [Chitinophagaceae bacterium]
MIITPSYSSKILAVIIAALAWFALTVQFILMVKTNTTPLPETIIRYFSFFTILTNLLVAVYATSVALMPSTSWGRFFSNPSVGTATTVYIVAVGVIYNAILRALWQPVGTQRIVDELLHTIIPFLFLMYWVLFLSRKELPWNAFFMWLIYPLAYCLYIIGRGYFSKFYPYPFMDVTKLGYKQVALNSLSVTIVFLGFSILLINIGRLKSSKK